MVFWTYGWVMRSLIILILTTTLAFAQPIDGRLTLTAGAPITSLDQQSRQKLFFTAWGSVRLYDGNGWVSVNTGELSVNVTSLPVAKVFDVFIDYNGGSPLLRTVIWASNTTRVTSLTYRDGVAVSYDNPTWRHVGSICTDVAASLVTDTSARRCVFNGLSGGFVSTGLVSGAINPYAIEDTGVTFPGYNDVVGRTEVSCVKQPGVNTKVIVFIGQSNNSSTTDQQYVPAHSLAHNFNYHDGRCYELRDPVLGASQRYAGGSSISRLVDKLITDGWADRIIAVPIAIDGTSIWEWAFGSMRHRIVVAMHRLKAAKLMPDIIYQHQGEKDTGLGTSRPGYNSDNQAVMQLFCDLGSTAPYIIARASYVLGMTSVNVRDGQVAAASAGCRGELGPDTDTLGSSHRHDNIHFNAAGSDAKAEMEKNVIRLY